MAADSGKVDHGWLNLLGNVSFRDVTDARDYIYAFLGCPAAKSDNGLPYVDADYTISKDELYKRVARTLLRNPKEGPWVLCATGCSGREELLCSHLPSWVPCWDTVRCVLRLSDKRFWFKAGGPESLLQTEEQDGATLSVRGQRLDEITWISDIIDSKSFLIAQNQPDAEPYIDKLRDQISRQMSKIGKEFQYKDFFLALLHGFPTWYSSPKAWQMHGISAYLESVGSKMAVDMSKEAPTDLQRAALAMEGDLRRTMGRRIAITPHGRLGIVEARSTRLGDTLCIFHGVSVPFVLAPTTDGRFKLAGQAYIHGVMGGELVDQSKAESILLE